ncbi:MAG TPA: Hsp20/alpha crystallin family protein [Halococcus sp.]|nr:Hsp20/alpha crystallin family protein [Halococcus sp.]
MPAPFPPPILPRRESSNRSPQPTEGPVEFYEEDGVYTLRIEMPGYEAENVSVTWHDGTVCVSTSFAEASGGNRTYHRAFWTPKEVDPETIDARYRSGILFVTLPIAEEGAPYGEEIEVKT